MDDAAAIFVDGFVTENELRRLQAHGAVGELASRPFDAEGCMMTDDVTERLTAMEIPTRPARPTTLVASGRRKSAALHAALRGSFANGIIIDEECAKALLRSAI